MYQTILALVLLSLAGHASTGVSAWLNGIFTFLLEAGGGVIVGLLCGFLVSRFVKFIDEPVIETTITIIVAYGVYLLADTLHVSGILALVVAALILGSYGRRIGMRRHHRRGLAALILLVGISLLFAMLLAFQQVHSG